MKEVLEKAYERTMGRGKHEELGDPYEVIAVKDRKNAKETTEVYMGRRGIEKLINFDHFMNLEVIWLNDNKLTKLEGLESNFRLKELYLHNNMIKSIDGCLPKLTHLRTVTLYNNSLSDLDVVLGHLKPLVYLNHLEMFDNPLSSEQHYRKRIVASLRYLTLLDRHSKIQIKNQKFQIWKDRSQTSS